jgi:hypothetical protein
MKSLIYILLAMSMGIAGNYDTTTYKTCLTYRVINDLCYEIDTVVCKAIVRAGGDWYLIGDTTEYWSDKPPKIIKITPRITPKK